MRYIAQALNQAFPQLNWQPPQATYLAWIDLRPLGVDDRALQKALIEVQKVAIMPGIPTAKKALVLCASMPAVPGRNWKKASTD
jgi:bifunctional pyridoxal-dependent enzyme with beta-cystathionase and maltose regulon repressor activities